jgi:hypothetical protein
MTDLDDDAVDKILRDRFEGPVPDDGFCDSAMARLPTRRRRTAWPLALGIAAGGVTCGASLTATPLFHTGWHDFLSGHLSAPAIAILATTAGLSLLALAWTTAEADDR